MTATQKHLKLPYVPTKDSKNVGWIEIQASELPETFADIIALFPNARFRRSIDGDKYTCAYAFVGNGMADWMLTQGVRLTKAVAAQQEGAFGVDSLMQFYVDLGYSLDAFCYCFHEAITTRYAALRQRTQITQAKKAR